MEIYDSRVRLGNRKRTYYPRLLPINIYYLLIGYDMLDNYVILSTTGTIGPLSNDCKATGTEPEYAIDKS